MFFVLLRVYVLFHSEPQCIQRLPKQIPNEGNKVQIFFYLLFQKDPDMIIECIMEYCCTIEQKRDERGTIKKVRRPNKIECSCQIVCTTTMQYPTMQTKKPTVLRPCSIHNNLCPPNRFVYPVFVLPPWYMSIARCVVQIGRSMPLQTVPSRV